jgi:hypothetical protein
VIKEEKTMIWEKNKGCKKAFVTRLGQRFSLREGQGEARRDMSRGGLLF